MVSLAFTRKAITLIVFPLQISIVGLASYFTKKIQAGFKNYHLLTIKFIKNHLYSYVPAILYVQCTNYPSFYLRSTLPLHFESHLLSPTQKPHFCCLLSHFYQSAETLTS